MIPPNLQRVQRFFAAGRRNWRGGMLGWSRSMTIYRTARRGATDIPHLLFPKHRSRMDN
jgi:hypothetical protein